jgi:hypothetical protein
MAETYKEKRAMRSKRSFWLAGSRLVLSGILTATGCYHTPVDTSVLAEGPAPLRTPSPARAGDCCYEDTLTGGQLFEMYCYYCHNPPNLSERNFANFRNVATHMRVRANLTGKEYAKIMEFLRRWQDVPPPTPPTPPSPTRLTFSQPISELRPQAPPAPAPTSSTPQAEAAVLPALEGPTQETTAAPK